MIQHCGMWRASFPAGSVPRVVVLLVGKTTLHILGGWLPPLLVHIHYISLVGSTTLHWERTESRLKRSRRSSMSRCVRHCRSRQCWRPIRCPRHWSRFLRQGDSKEDPFESPVEETQEEMPRQEEYAWSAMSWLVSCRRTTTAPPLAVARCAWSTLVSQVAQSCLRLDQTPILRAP